jgi:hypothetical protein
MIARTLLLLTTISLISGCSTLGNLGLFGKKEQPIQIVTKPVEIEIIQPTLPRPIQLQAPQWYVVSEAVVPNPCKPVATLDESGNPVLKEDGTPQTNVPKACPQEEKENPNWPVGYTYLDKFLEDIKIATGGDILFVASTVKDYELMSGNVQELRRYIRELGEVIVYYKEVTTKKPKQEEKVTEKVEN